MKFIQDIQFKLIKPAAFSLAVVLCLTNGIAGQQTGKNSSARKSSAGAVKLKKAMIIGRKNPVLVNPSSKQSKRLIAVGVVNGRATNLGKSVFPKNFQREIRVQVTIDEAGKVLSAKSEERNLTIRRGAEQAARKSTFAPYVLRGQPRKVFGYIVYKPTF